MELYHKLYGSAVCFHGPFTRKQAAIAKLKIASPLKLTSDMTHPLNSKKWHQKKRWILSLLLLCPPLGILLLWRTAWARQIKMTGTVISSLLLLSVLSDNSVEPETHSNQRSPAPASSTIATPTLTLTPSASAPITIATATTSPFNFPQSSCGDSSNDTNDTWYPVFVDGGTLENIRIRYCADAVATVREDTGADTVQIASFTRRDRAEAFAQAVKGEVGTPSTPDLAAESVASAPVTESVPITADSSTNTNECDPAYPGLCLPPGTGDLDCKDVSTRGFQVLPPDPHQFDRDRDGIGCES